MTLYAGLDVSLALTSICIVDAEGVVVRESKVSSEPEAICSALGPYADRLHRIGLEAGPLSQHLYSAMVEAGLPQSVWRSVTWRECYAHKRPTRRIAMMPVESHR